MKTVDISLAAIEDITPDAQNARLHTEEQIGEIAASIRTFGWTNPIIVDEADCIVAGHGRFFAAQQIFADGGLIRFPGSGGQELPAGLVPVINCSGWSEHERTAYMLADNQLVLNSTWDADLLAEQLRTLQDAEIDLGAIGFSTEDLATYLNGGKRPQTEPDEVPEPTPTIVCKLGDAWVLGDHRLVCGDSTKAQTVALLLDGAKPHLMVTDPPYGVEYDASFRNGIRRADGSIVGARAVGKVENDDRADWREAWDLFPGCVAYVWHAALFSSIVEDSLIASDFDLRASIVWVKNQFAIGRGHYHWQHEQCGYVVRKGKSAHWCGDRKQSTVWEIDKPRKSETGHSTQKPVECMRRPIVNNSKPGDALYEPFCGSGTTMIAAEMEGRRAYCMELSPEYCDVIIRRWQNFTGETAYIVGDDGRSFDDLALEATEEIKAD